MSKPLDKPLKVVVVVLVVLAFTCFGTGRYLDTLYYESRPRQPQPAEGRIFSQSVYHGTIVYLTRREQLALNYASPLGFLILMGAWSIYHRGNWR
jgi:hypothetical protein